MRNLKSVIFILVLTTLALAPCALAKSPLLLLQEGIYAEETEGDLDKAIGLYQQVIDNASEVERIAAKAAYKLGGCYLKKNDKASAAKYFQSVVEKYPSQTAYFNQAKEQLEKIAPAEEPQIPWNTLIYLAELHLSFAQQAEAKGLYVNTHIHSIDENYNRYSGGFINFKNKTGNVIDGEVSVGNFGRTNDIKLMNELGQTQKYRYVDRNTDMGRYSVMWTPDRPIQPDESRLLGYLNSKPDKLAKTIQGYSLKMNNNFGVPVLETFFVIVPKGMEIVNQSEDYTKKITYENTDIYYWQKEVPFNTTHEVNITLNYDQAKTLDHQQKEIPLFAQVSSDVLEYLGGQYGVIAAEASLKNLKFNNHIYYVSPELKLFWGGHGYYQQPANSNTPERICISGTTYPDQSFYDVIGNEMKVEIEDRPGKPGYYDIYWKPAIEIPAGQLFYYGWCRNKSKQLNPIANTNAYPVTMQNKFGQSVLEVFFLVLPEGFAVAEQSETFTQKETVAGFDIYQWKKEVPTSTNHIVNITLKKETFADKIQVYKVDKSVADFADDDFSTPESAYAAINKVSASGKAEGWKKASVPSLADRLPGKDSSVPEDWAEVLRNAKIAEVRIYDNKYAQVTAELLSEYSTKEIKQPFDIRHLELVDGKWLNAGNDRRNSLEETAELFEKVIQRKTGQQQTDEEETQKLNAAVKSASDWLGMIDNASYDQSWEAAASYFKSAVTQSQWEVAAKAAREPLGKLISREVLTKTYTKQVPGGPDGEYVIITFKASFENKKDAIETVTPMLDNDGKWKMSGYYIN